MRRNSVRRVFLRKIFGNFFTFRSKRAIFGIFYFALCSFPVEGNSRTPARNQGYNNRFGETIRTTSYSVSCYSCMSAYYESQYQWSFIAHMFKRPMVFNDACNFEELDVSHLRIKNCSDMCIWLRMEDRVAGRVRYGYLRGCMSDVLNYNHTTVRFLTYRTKCTYVKFADIFVRGSDYGFKNDEYAMLCACHSNRCNGGASTFDVSFGVRGLFLSLQTTRIHDVVLWTANALITLLINRIFTGFALVT